MVVIKEVNAPPLKWPLGRLDDSVIVGEDGIARVVVIRTAKGLVRRAIAGIAVLLIETKSVESLKIPSKGECLQQNAKTALFLVFKTVTKRFATSCVPFICYVMF